MFTYKSIETRIAEVILVALLAIMCFACGPEIEKKKTDVLSTENSSEEVPRANDSTVHEPPSPSDLFAEGRELVMRNCNTCRGMDPEERKRGVQLLEEAIAAGLDDAEAYRALAFAYNEIALDYDRGSELRKINEDKHRSARMHAVRLGGTAEDLLLLSHISDDAEAIELLRRAVALEPDIAAVNRSLGLRLVRSGDVDGGMPLLLKAIDEAPEHYVGTYARGAQDALREAGRDDLAAEIALHRNERKAGD